MNNQINYQISARTSNIIKSFARRKYKQISAQKCKLLDKYQSNVFSEEKLRALLLKVKTISLEIGFGNGDHLISKMLQYPQTIFLGCEVFLNGILNFLDKVDQLSLDNYMLFQDDINLLIPMLPNQILQDVYIFFPDPWPKTKHKKKRLINQCFLERLLPKLTSTSKIYCMSDNKDYAENIFKLLNNNRDYIAKIYHNPSGFTDYYHTKYYKKAINNGNTIYYIKAQG